jgi:LysM repeat protein
MAGDVHLPAVGSVSKRALWIGGTGAVVLVAVLWWRKRNTATAAAGDLAVDDTGTGEAGGGGTAGGGGSGGGVDQPAVDRLTTNPQWTALVMERLSGVVDPGVLSPALGLYLVGAAVSHEQELVIDQAISVAGYPPVSGPNGYPPAIHLQPPPGQTPAPSPAPTPAPTPPPAPKPPPAPVSHVVVRGDTLTSIGRSWGVSADAVYARNAGDIEYQAHIHGHPSSEHGHWIFPGTRLYKP